MNLLDLLVCFFFDRIFLGLFIFFRSLILNQSSNYFVLITSYAYILAYNYLFEYYLWLYIRVYREVRADLIS